MIATGKPIQDRCLREAVRFELQRILRSKGFVNSRRLRQVLSHIVEKSLDDREEDLKEYSLAVDVLERPATFNPQIDVAVRTTLHRLRLTLDAYYGTAGRLDEVLISIPLGHYMAKFEMVRAQNEAA